MTASTTFSILVGTVFVVAAASVPVSAAPRHKTHQRYASGVSYNQPARHGGYQALVSDGPGTGFGFHRLPGPYRYAAAVARDQQDESLRTTVFDDAVTNASGNFGYGLPGDSVYGHGMGASYGVFNGSDSYGSPYFAGYYGPGDGEDLGPLGHTYAD